MKTKPTTKAEQVERIKAALAGGDWILGKTLSGRAGVLTRHIRAAAEETGDIISGQKGYKLTSKATREEIRIAIADLLSRAAHLRARAERIQDAEDMLFPVNTEFLL